MADLQERSQSKIGRIGIWKQDITIKALSQGYPLVASVIPTKQASYFFYLIQEDISRLEIATTGFADTISFTLFWQNQKPQTTPEDLK